MKPWLVGGGMSLGAVGIASAAYQAVAEARDRRRFLPPGRLVDVGGRSLHLLDMGTGSPAVVVVPAVGGNVLDWLAFQRELARDMRVCVYDRAGYGWSDPPPRGRRTFSDMARELGQGLAGAGISPPYLLVGHSIGGIIARRFASLYPGDVAGMVLVDSSHEDQGRRYRAGDFWHRHDARRLWYTSRRRLRPLGLRRLAVQAGFGQLNDYIACQVPREYADAARAISLTTRHRQASAREQLILIRSYGQPAKLDNLPLTVLTKAGPDPIWLEMQAELADLSTGSTHIVATQGGHYLQNDEPDLVRSAIRDLAAHLETIATRGH